MFYLQFIHSVAQAAQEAVPVQARPGLGQAPEGMAERSDGQLVSWCFALLGQLKLRLSATGVRASSAGSQPKASPESST